MLKSVLSTIVKVAQEAVARTRCVSRSRNAFQANGSSENTPWGLAKAPGARLGKMLRCRFY